MEQLLEEEKSESNFLLIFHEYRLQIISCLYYICGLFIGSYFYKKTDAEYLVTIISDIEKDIPSLLCEKLAVYLLAYFFILFSAFSLIGKYIVNLVPFFFGLINGLNEAYLIMTHSFKGIAYCMILLVPYTALILSLLLLMSDKASCLSSDIFHSVKGDSSLLELKPYIISFIISASLVLLCAVINAIMTYLMVNIITI